MQTTTTDRALNLRTHADDMGGEEMMRLVQRVFLAASESAIRQVVFCGIGSENGSSTVCASAARTLAAISDRSVCVVDANLRSPHLSVLLGADTTVPSHTSSLLRDQCIELSENLWFAGGGLLSADANGFPSATKLKQLLAGLREIFEFVLIDAPGADVSGDAAVLGRLTDGTVLVIEAESTRRITARKVKESFDAVGIRLLGTVLHNRSFPIPKGLYERL